jgi:type VI secretion system protein ImpL
MLFKDIIRIVLYGVGLSSLSALVYLAGPFVAFGDYRPLENSIIRDIAILLLVTGAASFAGFKFWKRQKGAEKIAAGLGAEQADESDAAVLKDRMKDALTTLKNAAGGRATYLYDLPWYVLIGPPGSGKTTALVNSGLKFPLARGTRPAAIAGVGGTRYCDWWFTEDAVLIDTAGRYTTQDSDAKTDQKSWFAFLDTLKKGRPRQPINGVVVAISIEDLLTLGPAELSAHADAIRARLLELHSRLKVDFPVYVLLTKADLILGFTEHFQNLGENGRRQVFGVTFQTGDKSLNLVNSVPDEFNTLVERLNEDMPDRLQEEPDPVSRAQSYGFPTQLEALKRPLCDFLNQVFEPTRYHAKATLRGFYFTSGTQQGTPIDQLIGALQASFGAVELPA